VEIRLKLLCFGALLVLFVISLNILMDVFIVYAANESSNDGSRLDTAVKEFLSKYTVPDFVLKSIPETLPDVLKDGAKLSYVIALEGIVVLKNNGVLPLDRSSRVAVFGVAQHWAWNYHCGGSSYVKVPEERLVTLLEGLRNAGFNVDEEIVSRYEEAGGKEIVFSDEEMKEFAARNNVAIVVIGRSATEGADISDGSFYLRDNESRLLDQVTKFFDKVIVILNTPGPISINWDNEGIDAIVWVGFPGEQGGNAIASILAGIVSPSGRLPDTWAKSLEDYPSTKYFSKFVARYYEDIYVGYRYFDTFNISPAYPFGYGLSYTDFEIEVLNTSLMGTQFEVSVLVRNKGHYPGKEVVQVYVSKPNDELENPYQELIAFAKTDVLDPGKQQVINITINISSLASYDENTSSWVLAKGDYIIRVGASSRNTSVAAILTIPNRVVLVKTQNRLHSPHIDRLSKKGAETFPYPCREKEIENAPKYIVNTNLFKTMDKSKSITEINKPPKFPEVPEQPIITLKDIVEGKHTLEELIGQLSLRELVDITIGLRAHISRKIPELRHADGPNGLRDGPSPNPGGIAYPSASILAASWNTELARIYGIQIGREMRWANITLWLAPAVNIHRNPLGGRNAEYFSEDPLLTGILASEIVKGVQSHNGIGVVVKHFVAYEQEFNRFKLDVYASERALREIYLKPFEIIVKTADPWCIMTSYNKLNGIYTGNDPELIQGILRYEWGFNGFVMTDWGSGSYNYMAYIAGNDALMPYEPNLFANVWKQVETSIKIGDLNISYLRRSAYNILKVTLRSRALAETLGIPQEKLYTYEPPSSLITITKALPETIPQEKTTTTTQTTAGTETTAIQSTTTTTTTTTMITTTTQQITKTEPSKLDLTRILLILLPVIVAGIIVLFIFKSKKP